MNETELAEAYARTGPSHGPAYVRLKLMFQEGIARGNWAEGDRLPSENELVRALGLARMTVNRALRELAKDDVVERVIGLGTFVAAQKGPAHLFELRNRADGESEPGRHRVEMIESGSVPATRVPSAVRSHFANEAFRTLVLHFEDRLPVQLEERYVHPERAPEYLRQDFSSITPSAYLNDVARFSHGEHVVSAVRPTESEARLLQIDVSEPCLQIERRTWSAVGFVSAARLLHPGSRSELEGEFRV